MPNLPRRDIVVLGASAGGLEALTHVVRALPADLPASLFVVLHTPPDGAGLLPQILTRTGPLTAAYARDGEPIVPGRIYVAPLDRHLLVKSTGLRAIKGAKENGFRPAVDPLFRSAARAFGPRVLGIVLSGAGDDGATGAKMIKEMDGAVMVQHPDDALVSGMPLAAIRRVEVDGIVPARELGAMIIRLTTAGVLEGRAAVPKDDEPLDEAEMIPDHIPNDRPPSVFTCPDCGGALWELEGGDAPRYRCHVGHAFTTQSLLTSQSGDVEAALWSALRALREHAELQRRMSKRARGGKLLTLADTYETRAEDAEARASVIENVLLRDKVSGSGEGT
jgi:two-component system, chemotaxis family, protein-glutamate methylesterase/glutaminase